MELKFVNLREGETLFPIILIEAHGTEILVETTITNSQATAMNWALGSIQALLQTALTQVLRLERGEWDVDVDRDRQIMTLRYHIDLMQMKAAPY
mgnify:CR=1 FL=1